MMNSANFIQVSHSWRTVQDFKGLFVRRVAENQFKVSKRSQTWSQLDNKTDILFFKHIQVRYFKCPLWFKIYIKIT